jgi:hypothetical protein
MDFNFMWCKEKTLLVGELEEKSPLGGPRHRGKYNVKMDVREIGHEGADWI